MTPCDNLNSKAQTPISVTNVQAGGRPVGCAKMLCPSEDGTTLYKCPRVLREAGRICIFFVGDSGHVALRGYPHVVGILGDEDGCGVALEDAEIVGVQRILRQVGGVRRRLSFYFTYNRTTSVVTCDSDPSRVILCCSLSSTGVLELSHRGTSSCEKTLGCA